MKSVGDVPIYRMVLAQSLVELDRLTLAVCIPDQWKGKQSKALSSKGRRLVKGTVVIGYNTDAIKIKGVYNKSEVKTKDSAQMGGYHLESSKTLSGYSIHELDEKETYVYKPLRLNESNDTPIDITKSQLVGGQAGCGKTTLIIQNKQNDDVVLSYTNASCERLKKDGVEARTCDSFMFNAKTGQPETKRFEGVPRVWLDEYKTVPPSLMSAIMNAKEQYGFILICLGDHRQTNAPCDNWVEYHTNKRFLEALDGNVLTLSYKFKRYDKPLYDVLCEFENTGFMKMPIGTMDSYHNICKYNAKRHIINKQCLARWFKEKGQPLVRITGTKQTKSCSRDVCIGLPMMAYDENDLELEIYKTDRWIVSAIEQDTITLTRNDRTIDLTHAKFISIFDYSFAYTMYKIQGIEITEPFNIWEAERMSHNELYTAVSRGVKKEHVHIDGLLLMRYKRDEVSHLTHKMKVKEEYTGRIYMMRFSDDKGYIGQTTQTLLERFAQHKLKATNAKVASEMNDETTIELLEEITYTDNRQLDDMEKAYIRKYENEMELLNERLITKADKVNVVKEVKPKKGKYNIKENIAKKRYEIYVGRKTETFNYAMRTPEIAMAEAVKRQTELRAM